MAKEKLNKDGLVPGAPVNEEDYNRIINAQRRKDPYIGLGDTRLIATTQIIQKQQQPEYLQQVAKDKIEKQSKYNG